MTSSTPVHRSPTPNDYPSTPTNYSSTTTHFSSTPTGFSSTPTNLTSTTADFTSTSAQYNPRDDSSSTPSSPEPLEDDERDGFTLLNNESQSSFGVPSSPNESPRASPEREQLKSINRLPPELLIYVIAKFSSSQDIFNCLRVSKTWARCTVDLLWHRPLFTSWEKLHNIAASIQDPNSYWPYADLIKRLNLSNLHKDLNDGSLQPFVNCKRIERLTLTSCSNLTDHGIIALIAGNRNLLALDITSLSAITDLTIMALARHCPRLQGLNITNCKKVTDESLVALANSCKYLKRVRRRDPIYSRIANLAGQLKLNRCTLVTDDSIEAFARQCPSMLEIDLQDCRTITDTSVSALISGGRQLRELRLAQCQLITDQGFLSLSPRLKYESLRILDLTACQQLTDLAVERIIDSAPRLRILVLAKCVDITDRSVMAITKLGKNLHDIHLGRCSQVSDEALKELVKACNRIRYIDLAGCHRVTDASVKLLATLPKLRRIGLVKCQAITDRSILALARAHHDPARNRLPVTSNLERVHLSYCVNITLQGIHALLNHCPKLTHLSLTGIQAFFLRDDLVNFCREAPSEFNEEQRNVFCVFSGEGVNRLRDYLNKPGAVFENEATMFQEQSGDEDAMVGLMQSTGLEADDGDEFEVEMPDG